VSPIDVGLLRSEALLENGFRDELALADPRGAEALSCVSFRGHVVPESARIISEGCLCGSVAMNYRFRLKSEQRRSGTPAQPDLTRS
jgi:hypothetical protein